jgi:deoxyhypusine synthase
MNIYIDCEFNGFGGQLISMALVAEDGNEFYEVVPLLEEADPWVAKHVMPILNKDAVSPHNFKQKLYRFINQYNEIHVIADWPGDIRYFCEELIVGPSIMKHTKHTPAKMTMEIIRDINSISRLPHNALEDARAIAAYMMGSK